MKRTLLFIVGIALAGVIFCVVLALWLASYAVPALRFETQEHSDYAQG